jgi:hypothetical protein
MMTSEMSHAKTPCPRDADLRNGSCQEEEREITHLQKNNKAKPEQLKLSKIDSSMWPSTTDS